MLWVLSLISSGTELSWETSSNRVSNIGVWVIAGGSFLRVRVEFPRRSSFERWGNQHNDSGMDLSWFWATSNVWSLFTDAKQSGKLISLLLFKLSICNIKRPKVKDFHATCLWQSLELNYFSKHENKRVTLRLTRKLIPSGRLEKLLFCRSKAVSIARSRRFPPPSRDDSWLSCCTNFNSVSEREKSIKYLKENKNSQTHL